MEYTAFRATFLELLNPVPPFSNIFYSYTVIWLYFRHSSYRTGHSHKGPYSQNSRGCSEKQLVTVTQHYTEEIPIFLFYPNQPNGYSYFFFPLYLNLTWMTKCMLETARIKSNLRLSCPLMSPYTVLLHNIHTKRQ